MPTTALEPTIDELHRYWLGNKQKAGVSQILEGTGFIQPNSFWTDEGREKGIRLHAACFEINMETFDFDDTDLDVYLEAVSYAEWKVLKGFKILFDLEGKPLAERRFYSSIHDFCGTLDAFGTFGDNAYVVVDFKRGKAMACAKYQTALYVQLICENSERLLGKKIYPFQVKRFALDGIGRERPHMEPFEDKTDLNIALAAVTCFNRQVRDGIRKL
ncbi:hypothetical protein [Candidatus Manganitrophus noduliformans]|uniref:PD-(D/E)XK endonuclease-like domain-containing protein n=1 Tax=Candidatus Manganitrophus noduliformans TaxID=2606439 RepID=A0A7X6I9U5_9BACT|nr:hypothetical protein [Candidatus Manganitrophus noduliformans]NKE69848.1 hypothetical protein [Candidatus Manganitrophus noduliformans]